MDEKEKYDVENIIDFRLTERDINKRLQYKINWVEHSSDRKWYSIENFKNAKEIVADFHARHFDKFESHFISISFIKHTFCSNSFVDVKTLIKETLNRMKRKINVDIIKQTSITLALNEIIKSQSNNSKLSDSIWFL